MDKIYENISKYGEEMKGKFSHKQSRNGIVISVKSPFVEEIHIESDNDIHAYFSNTYSLLAPQADHPDGADDKIYYNTEEKCYYRCEWRSKNPEQPESEWGYIWILTDSQDIVKHARKCEELQAHYRSYHAIHKGQLCVFTGYAVDPNGDYKRPSTIDSKLILHNRTNWFFNPWSFKVSLLNEDTIDDFVKEVPISKEMTQKMVLYHQKQDEIKEQKEEDDKRKKNKEKWKTRMNKIQDHIKEYEPIYKYVVPGGILALLASIIQLVIVLVN